MTGVLPQIQQNIDLNLSGISKKGGSAVAVELEWSTSTSTPLIMDLQHEFDMIIGTTGH
jgi:hypothetical protein